MLNAFQRGSTAAPLRLLRNQLDEASADFDTIVDSTGKSVEALFYVGRSRYAGETWQVRLRRATGHSRAARQFVPAYVLLAQAQLLGGQNRGVH
jgi:hypothetical protein